MGGAVEVDPRAQAPWTPKGTRRRLDLGMEGTDVGDDSGVLTNTQTQRETRVVDGTKTDVPKSISRSLTQSVDDTNNSTSPQKRSTEQLWSYLLGNMVRAVDEVYFLCELECGKPEIDGTVTLLEQSARDFKQLARTIKDQDDVRRFGLKSISWDVARMDVRPSERNKEIIEEVLGAKRGGTVGMSKQSQQSRSSKNQIPNDKIKSNANLDGWQTAGRGGKPKGSSDNLHGDARAMERKPSKRSRRQKETRGRHDKGESDANADKKKGSKQSSAPVAGKPPKPPSKGDTASSGGTLATSGSASHIRGGLFTHTTSHGSSNSVRSMWSIGSGAFSTGSVSSTGSRWSDMSDDDELPPVPFELVGTAEQGSLNSTSGIPSSGHKPWGVKRDWDKILGAGDSLPGTFDFSNRLKSEALREMLHLKLMSPDRKKKTPSETAQALLERQKRATELRLKAEADRVERMRNLRGDVSKPKPTSDSLREEQERVAEEKAEKLLERQRRAEETRVARIEQVVKKASEETRKVEEISKLLSKEQEAKQDLIDKKLADAEKRRNSVAELKLKAAETERAAAAAEERRLAEEMRKRLFLEQRVQEKEKRRASIAAESEKSKVLISEKRDVETAEKAELRVQRERDLKREADLRRNETRNRLLAADSRRREYLNVVRERAVGSSMPGRSDTPTLSKQEKVESGISTPPISHPASPSRLRIASESISTPVSALESPSRPTRVVAGEALERRVAAVQDRHRGMRKRAKKLRHKLGACAAPVVWRRAGDEVGEPETNEESSNQHANDHSEEKSWATLPLFADAAHGRLRKLAVAVARRDPVACFSAHREVRVALAEAGAAAAAAGAEEHSDGLAPGAAAAAAALAAAVTSGLVKALAEALAECLAASAQGGGFLASPNAAVTCVSLAVALETCSAGSPLAAECLLVENLAAPLIPHLVAGLGLVGDPAAAETATPGAGGGVPPPTAALEPLLAVTTRVVQGPWVAVLDGNGSQKEKANPCKRSKSMRDDFVELLIASGCVDALASLFALCDRPKEQGAEPIPPAITAGLRLLESLLDARAPGTGDVTLRAASAKATTTSSVLTNDLSTQQLNDDSESPAGSLLVALRATALAGLPSLLTSVLLQTENETRVPVLQDPRASLQCLPTNFVSVATVVMRLLNCVTKFGRAAVQTALSSSDLRVETHHLVSVVLSLCCAEWNQSSLDDAKWSKDSLSTLLNETLLFIGHFALTCSQNQDMLSWGRAPTLVQRLADLPFEYYADDAKKSVSFPTLIAVAFKHNTNTKVIAREMSLVVLKEFITVHLNAMESLGNDEGTEGTDEKKEEVLPVRFAFGTRFPKKLWGAAVAYFAE